MDTQSPFSVSEADARSLEQNDGFRIVRTHLANQENNSFCSSHFALSQSSQQTFILHRDVLHSLLLPVLQIRSQAAVFAAQAISQQFQNTGSGSPTSPRTEFDLEVAFHGAGRGAFSWLQCFVAEERDWCSTKGCPACVVLRIMHAEPFIRIVVASCRLSGHLREMLQGAEQGGENGISAPGSASLPEFGFWQSAIRQAVSEDEFWGLHFWEDIESRAVQLELGVKDLIRQCSEICSPSPTRPALQRRAITFCGTPAMEQDQPATAQGSSSRRSSRSPEEEQEWMRSIIEACWMALMQDSSYRKRKASGTAKRRHGDLRIRSLTA